VRIADEVAIGEEQELNEVPVRFAHRRRGLDRPGGGAAFTRCVQTDVGHYVSYIDISRFDCYPQKRNVTATSCLVRPRRGVAQAPKGARIGPAATIPGVLSRRKSRRP